MKKLLVKAEFIVTPYSPAVEGIAECWVKEQESGIIEVFYEQPKLENGSPDLTYTHHLAIEGLPEISEVKEWRVIAQTQGSDEELAQWLAGDSFKYPEGYTVEYIDISAQVEQERINAESLKYLADTDWLIIREVDAGVPCPVEIKATRQLMRERIIKE
jgi:type II secretory pathway component PulC